MDHRFEHDRYTVRRKVLTLTGASFHVFDGEERLVFFSRLKAFKLKEDIRLYADEGASRELMTMKARSIVDFGATYDIFDAVANESAGSLRRKGMKSMLRDEWLIFDRDGRELAAIREDGAGLAILRRMHEAFTLIAPQVFHVEMGGERMCLMAQNRNPFVHKLFVDFSMDREKRLDRRLGLAAAILISAVEGRQG